VPGWGICADNWGSLAGQEGFVGTPGAGESDEMGVRGRMHGNGNKVLKQLSDTVHVRSSDRPTR
jgi:hypothetical protein